MTDKLQDVIFINVESPLHYTILNKDLALSRDGDLERCEVLTYMDYKKIHDQIIDRAKTRSLNSYKERHHIIPRCMGGTDEKSNLVELTAREHFIIHKLLCEIYPHNDKLFFAYRMMAIMTDSKDNSRFYKIGSREFERIRLISSNLIGNALRGRKHLKSPSMDTINKRSYSRKQRVINDGYYHSEETKKKMSNTHKGKTLSDEHKTSISNSLTGNPKVTGRALTADREIERKRKIQESWANGTRKKKGGLCD